MIEDLELYKIQKLFKNQEVVDVPRTWATVLVQGNLLNVAVRWVTLDMIKDYKLFLRKLYVSRNEDLEKKKFEVKRVGWFNYGYGERVNETGQLELVHHPESVFIRCELNPKQPPREISFVKQRQGTELRPELLKTLRQERRPVRDDVKRDCVEIAQKYLSENAIRFYQSLPTSIEEENDSSVNEMQ